MAFTRDQQQKNKKKDVHELVKEAEEQKKVAVSAKLEKGGRRAIKTAIYYALPLLSIAIFFGILVFGTVPAARGIMQYRGDQKVKNNEILELDQEIASLQDLKSKEAEFQRDLDIIDKIIPSAKTEVVKFVGEIAALSEQYNLEEDTSATSELTEKLQEKIEEKIETESVAIIQIPTTSEYKARFDDIKSFLNALYNKDDFIIVRRLEMQGFAAREFEASQQQRSGEDVTVDTSLSPDTWTIDVTFEKYQFSKSFSEYILENLVSISTEPKESTLKYIRTRYGG